MKKTINITISILAALLLAACNGMENPPQNQYTDANFWSAERAKYMVNTAYSQMYSAGKLWDDEELGDNVFQVRSGSSLGRVLRTGSANSATGGFNSQWGDAYTCIKSCHVFLDNVESLTDMDPAAKARLVAEARFIRAYTYFRLINFYGDVPFFTKDITATEAQTIARTPKAEVLAFIRSELETIIADLPRKDDQSEADKGRITKGAAQMLLARTYLYQQDTDWAAVERETAKLINNQAEFGTYSLCPTYAEVFDEENEYNEEVILDRAYVQNLITWDQMQDRIPLSRSGRVLGLVPIQSLVDNYLTIGGYTIHEAGSDYDPANPYENRDPRMAATIIYDGYDWDANVPAAHNFFIGRGKIYIDPNRPESEGSEDRYDPSANSSRSGYYTRKWYSPQAAGQNASGLNIIMMRYADVLLMYAEAMLEQNKLTEAVWNQTVRPIRERAGFTAAKALDFPAGKSQAELRTILRNERRSELAIEGLRSYDIMRWKAGSQYFTGKPEGASFAVDLGATYKFDESRDYLFAVPQTQIDLNGNLLPQNPGY